eukprot:TRINITY_DN116_c0_g1_i1.p1 TRINITY_DN116_c0_g1~~TRINITY_DN116_c0_g1_i1.p1  ORF type:complete len:226 (-),score=105.24 TRINITY_DN116_c0_g1_i1:72-749(-)
MRKSVLFKVVVLGESGVGKTSLLLRYIENKFTLNTKSTIGSDFLSKDIEVDGRPVTLQIWDTAGQERFQGLGTAFYRGADGAMFVFDYGRKKTFDELAAWKKAFLIQIGQENNPDFPIVIVGNKMDLENKEVTKKEAQENNPDFPIVIVGNKMDLENKEVTKKEAQDWCYSQNLPFYETSAKESVNVEKSFDQIAKLVLSKTKEEDIKFQTVDLSKQTKKDDGCC